MAKTPQTLIQAPGCTVPQEDGQPWPAEGMLDPCTLYTRRRVRSGDLIPAPAGKAAAPVAAAAVTPPGSNGDAK